MKLAIRLLLIAQFFLMSAAIAESGLQTIQQRHDHLLDEFYNAVDVSPYAYYTDYRVNQFSADKKYKNQWIVFRGVVNRIIANHNGDPIVYIASSSGMPEQVELGLFAQQIVSHDDSGYHSLPVTRVAERLVKNEKVVANCYAVGMVNGGPSADNCLIYSSDEYAKIYNVKQ